MKKFRTTPKLWALAAVLIAVYSCESPSPDNGRDNEIIVCPEDFPYAENTCVITRKNENAVTYRFESTALMMIGENIAIAASEEEGLSDVTSIMDGGSGYFFTAISPMLLGKEFDPGSEETIFTIISTLENAAIASLSPEDTSEIKEGKCLVTFEDGILTLKAELILSDDTLLGIHIKAEESAEAPIEVNENQIGRGEEVKLLRTAFYKEDSGLTYLFFTPANISYFEELSIATWYLYFVVPDGLITGTTVDISLLSGSQTFMFGMVDNVNEGQDFNVDNSTQDSLKGTFKIASSGPGLYSVLIGFTREGMTYQVAFDGECTSADIEAPVVEKEIFFEHGGEKYEIESVTLDKGEEIWTLSLHLSNGKTATVTMSVKFWEQGGTFGFSMDSNMAVTYDGTVYSKANGHSGTLTMNLDETSGIVETEFTNYAGCRFYYKGLYR